MLRYTLLVFILACGGNQGCGGSVAAPSTPEAVAESPILAVHEWGLVSVGPNGVELAAGPGMQQLTREEMISVDKPVLYVHANAPSPLHVEVTPGEGMSMAEYYPPSAVAPAASPLSWDVEVTPGECTTPRDYSGSCNSTDGYCETHELALYETGDAACLTQAGLSLPLLFYRLRADAPHALPLDVDHVYGSGASDVTVRNSGLETGASIWRVTWDGTQAHATRSLAPALGEPLVIQRSAQGGVGEVRAAIRQDLADLGLTEHEAEAFMRAWDTALFGAEGSIDGDSAFNGDSVVDGIPADVPPADSPVDVDSLTNDETVLDRRVIPGLPGAPRVTDALLYWLPPANIESMATLSFQPAPQEVSRAILVRVDVR